MDEKLPLWGKHVSLDVISSSAILFDEENSCGYREDLIKRSKNCMGKILNLITGSAVKMTFTSDWLKIS